MQNESNEALEVEELDVHAVSDGAVGVIFQALSYADKDGGAG